MAETHSSSVTPANAGGVAPGPACRTRHNPHIPTNEAKAICRCAETLSLKPSAALP
jgi:hypothetical protein